MRIRSGDANRDTSCCKPGGVSKLPHRVQELSDLSPGHVGQESGGLIHQHYGQQDGDVSSREVTSQKERSKGSDVVSPRGDRVDARGERPAEEHLGTPNRAIARVALHRRSWARKSSANLRAPPDADCRPGLKKMLPRHGSFSSY